MAQASGPAEQRDEWVHSVCDSCYSNCGILVHRVDGRVVKVEGDPDCPHNRGRICGKGQASIMGLYDPNRLTVPMKRTNPEKGLGVDPRWVPISWEEAFSTVIEQLQRVRDDDPRKLVVSSWDVSVLNTLVPAWCSAYGTPNSHWSGYYCGQYLHASMYLTNGTFHSDFDIDRCRYLILLGNQAGFLAGLNPTTMATRMAAARARGLHVVAVDPISSHAGSKADEWVPIRPGTDAAFILALLHVLLLDLGIYDAPFLRGHTNAPYLVGEDGLYVRDEDGRPQLWDLDLDEPVPFDAPAANPALEGSFRVRGADCRPAFDLLLRHLGPMSPEWASQVTSVPAATIRRIAREFGEAACIGSTISVDGRVLPYRPAAVNIYRGAGAHKHGVHVALAVQILNMVVGGFYRPGGHRGVNLIGPRGSWGPSSHDGLIVPPHPIGRGARYYDFNVKRPETMGAGELFPNSTNRSPIYELASLDPEQFRLPYAPDTLIVCRRNHFLSNVSHRTTAEAMKKYRFIAFFGTHLDEVAEFADIALPDQHFLEKLEIFPNRDYLSVSPSTGAYYWGVRQPVVDPPPGVRQWMDVMMEIAQRMGFLDDVHRLLNGVLHIEGANQLQPDQRYTLEEVFDRSARSRFGEDMGLDWFREHGYHSVERTVAELYPLDSLPIRVPLYFENLLRAGTEVRTVTRGLGLESWDTSDYVPLPVWRPCPAYRENPGGELYAVNFRLPTQYQSISAENPWLQEVAQANPYAQRLLIHAETARTLGIAEGDRIAVESQAGRVDGYARLTELVHPEVVGISGHFGAFARGKPVARGHGANFNNLVPLDLEHIDWVSSGVDSCVRVHVRRLDGPRHAVLDRGGVGASSIR